MCANLALRSACVYAAVTIYHEVIADAVEASLAMPAINIFNAEVLALCSGTAMNDDLCNFSHDFFFSLCYYNFKMLGSKEFLNSLTSHI